MGSTSHNQPDMKTMMRTPKALDQSIRRRKRTASHDVRLKHIEATTYIVDCMAKDSKVFLENPAHELPTFNPSEIVDGVKLGTGEFGQVHEIKEFLVPEQCTCYLCKRTSSESEKTAPEASKSHSKSSDSTLYKRSESKVSFSEVTAVTDCVGKTIHVTTCEEKLPGSTIGSLMEDDLSEGERVSGGSYGGDWTMKCIEREYRGFMKSHASRDGIARYAIKRARSDLDKDSCTNAIVDLAAESKFLSALCHPNIVKMRGTISFPGHEDFGLVLDRMQLTLTDQILLWREQEKATGPLSRIGRLFNRKQLREEHVDRLVALYDIARALKFLHKNNILFRDLKSDNVGCDVRGDFKIFDFGLARELKEKDLVKPPDSYKITGATGSRRYMAPENLLCLDYGLSADTYSFAILFWEVCSLKVPFATYSTDRHFRDVILKGNRPSLAPTSWLPARLLLLMKECWAPTPSGRPTFQRIYQVLRSEIHQVGEELGRGSIKDRSKHMLDRSQTSYLGGRSVVSTKRRFRRIANEQVQPQMTSPSQMNQVGAEPRKGYKTWEGPGDLSTSSLSGRSAPCKKSPPRICGKAQKQGEAEA